MSAEDEEARRKRIELIEDAVHSRKLVGQRVRLQGLTSKPELNGRTGKVCPSWTGLGRSAVRLDGEPKPISVRRSAVRLESMDESAEEAEAEAFVKLGHRVQIEQALLQPGDSGAEPVASSADAEPRSELPPAVRRWQQQHMQTPCDGVFQDLDSGLRGPSQPAIMPAGPVLLIDEAKHDAQACAIAMLQSLPELASPLA